MLFKLPVHLQILHSNLTSPSALLLLLLFHCKGLHSSVSMCFDLLHLTVTPLPQPPPALACSLLLGVSSPHVRVGIYTSPTCQLNPPSLTCTHTSIGLLYMI